MAGFILSYIVFSFLQAAPLRHSMGKKTWSDTLKLTPVRSYLTVSLHLKMSGKRGHKPSFLYFLLQVRSRSSVSCATNALAGGTSSTCTAARTRARSLTSANCAPTRRPTAAAWRSTCESTTTSGPSSARFVPTPAVTPASSPCTCAPTPVGRRPFRLSVFSVVESVWAPPYFCCKYPHVKKKRLLHCPNMLQDFFVQPVRQWLPTFFCLVYPPEPFRHSMNAHMCCWLSKSRM